MFVIFLICAIGFLLLSLIICFKLSFLYGKENVQDKWDKEKTDAEVEEYLKLL